MHLNGGDIIAISRLVAYDKGIVEISLAGV